MSKDPLEELASAVSVEQDIAALSGQILDPGLCETVTFRRGHEDEQWLVSIGRSRRSKSYGLGILNPDDQNPHHHDEAERALSAPMLLLDGNPGKPIASLSGGFVVPETDKLEVDGHTNLSAAVRDTLTEILRDSQRTVTDRQAFSRKRRNVVLGRTVRSVVAAAITGGLIYEIPAGVNEYDHMEQQNRAAEVRQASLKASEQAAAARTARARISAFDRRYPDLRPEVTLQDQIVTAVPFSQEFSGVNVPAERTGAVSSHIRSLALPALGSCVTYQEALPLDARLQVSFSGNPNQLVAARQNSILGTLQICSLQFGGNPPSGDSKDSSGQLFLNLPR